MKEFGIENSSLSLRINEESDRHHASITVRDSYEREEIQVPLDVVGDFILKFTQAVAYASKSKGQRAFEHLHPSGDWHNLTTLEQSKWNDLFSEDF